MLTSVILSYTVLVYSTISYYLVNRKNFFPKYFEKVKFFSFFKLIDSLFTVLYTVMF